MFRFFKRSKSDVSIETHLPDPSTELPAEEPTDLLEDTASAAVLTPPAVLPAEAQTASKLGWFTRLKSGLSKTRAGFTTLFSRTTIDEALFEALEEALLLSDAGVEATDFLLDALRDTVRKEHFTEPHAVKAALRAQLITLLAPLEKAWVLGHEKPLVVMVAGVNGVGKTTSIGKLTQHLRRYGQSVLLAAGDTFRAAAREQLAAWGARNQVSVISQENSDPAAVVFDAVHAASARHIDVLIADTAGRLSTQLNLMQELKKIHRVIGKAKEGAPHEVLLVIDATTGQNALAQVKAFDDVLGLTGLIITKLDGSAKGGILAAIARQRPIPVYFVGVGEAVDDLQAFQAEAFVDAMLGER